MKYLVKDTDQVFYNIIDVLDFVISDDYHADDENFEESVNDNYGSININGAEYNAFDIVKECDYYNFRELQINYCEEQNDRDREEAEYQLQDAENGDVVYVQGYTIEVIDEDTGDFDGDVDQLMTDLRQRLNVNAEEKAKELTKDKESEDNLMKMFQTIGD